MLILDFTSEIRQLCAMSDKKNFSSLFGNRQNWVQVLALPLISKFLFCLIVLKVSFGGVVIIKDNIYKLSKVMCVCGPIAWIRSSSQDPVSEKKKNTNQTTNKNDAKPSL